MFDFFQPVIDFMMMIVEWIQSLFEIIGMAVNVLRVLIGFLPIQISVTAGILLVVCVIYKILGRESQD